MMVPTDSFLQMQQSVRLKVVAVCWTHSRIPSAWWLWVAVIRRARETSVMVILDVRAVS